MQPYVTLLCQHALYKQFALHLTANKTKKGIHQN